MFRAWVVGAVLAVAAFVVSAPASAGVTRQVVRGRLNPVAQDATTSGRFRMIVADRTNGTHWERIESFGRHLDLSAASAQNVLSFHLFLIKEDGTGAADFGAVRYNRHGSFGFIFDTRRSANPLPDGVTSLTDFNNGTIEIRDGSNAVLTGSVGDFNDRQFGHDRERLVSTDRQNFRGRGQMFVGRQSTADGTQEELSCTCNRMTASTTYTVVAIDGSAVETSIGTFTTGSPMGVGGFRLSTRNGDSMPGGSVINLAGQTVEVRDGGGAAVLHGQFPTIPAVQ